MGVLSRIMFWGWQVIILFWFVSYNVDVSPILLNAQSDFERAGASIGIAFSYGIILFFWVGVSIVLGIFVLLTRPARTLVPDN